MACRGGNSVCRLGCGCSLSTSASRWPASRQSPEGAAADVGRWLGQRRANAAARGREETRRRKANLAATKLGRASAASAAAGSREHEGRFWFAARSASAGHGLRRAAARAPRR